MDVRPIYLQNPSTRLVVDLAPVSQEDSSPSHESGVSVGWMKLSQYSRSTYKSSKRNALQPYRDSLKILSNGTLLLAGAKQTVITSSSLFHCDETDEMSTGTALSPRSEQPQRVAHPRKWTWQWRRWRWGCRWEAAIVIVHALLRGFAFLDWGGSISRVRSGRR